MKHKTRMKELLWLTAYAAIATTSVGCFDMFEDDCYEAEPSTEWLTFSLPTGVQPVIGEELHVGVQFLRDSGRVCHNNLENVCECTDPPAGVQHFVVTDAFCEDGGCEVIGSGSMGWLGEVRIVPTSSQTTLQVTAEHEDRDLQVTNSYQIFSSP